MINKQISRKRKKFEELFEQRKYIKRIKDTDRTARSKFFIRKKEILEYK